VIGFIPDIPGLATRHFPTWRKAVAGSDFPFALTRRLFAAAIGKHLRGRDGEIYFDEFITLPGREIPIRIYPQQDGGEPGTVVYFHGGGNVSGNLDTHHGFCLALRDLLGASVLSVHCRRAPENPHPAQVEDALEAIRYASSCSGLLPESPQGLILAGDSAGGFVAFRSALALAEVIRLRGLLLFYPALEPDDSKSSFITHAKAPGLTADTMRQYWDALLGYDQGLRDRLDLTAADLRNMPPTAVIVAEQDPLRDDGTKLVRLLNNLEKPAACVMATGTTHGFCRVVQQQSGAMAWVEAGIGKFRQLLG
jgi:acetyl esterase